MDWKILIAAIGFGAGGEAVRRYRAFKARRRGIPSSVRNAGFWTDNRLYHCEAIFAALALCVPIGVIIMLVSADRPFWVFFAILLLYPTAIYLLLKSFNVRA